MAKFEILVQVTHTRKYEVEAEDGDDALDKYVANEADFVDDDMAELGTWVEDGDTAEVYATDEAHTLIVTAGDME